MHKRSFVVVLCPLRFAGGDRALLAVEQRLPRYLSQEGAALRANVINLELVGQRLQLHRDLSRLFSAQVDAYGRCDDRDEQAHTEKRGTSFSQEADHDTNHTRQRKRQRLQQACLELIG